MDQEFKAKIFQILFVVLIVGVLAFMIFMVIWLRSESTMCLRDPIQFMTEKTGQQYYSFNPKI
jgi:uncharacterized BrkB/YihY/UPF0761 family membrane protein